MTYIQYTYNCTYTIYIHYINTVAYARYCQVQYPTGIVSFYYFYSPKGNKSFKCKTGVCFLKTYQQSACPVSEYFSIYELNGQH